MPEALKEKFNLVEVKRLATQLSSQWSSFPFDAFIQQASNQLETLELKARSNQIKQALLDHMPADFEQVADIIYACLAPASPTETIQFTHFEMGLSGWILMPVTDYITEVSLTDQPNRFTTGLALLRACTQRFSAEFSIRPFLRDHTMETLSELHAWAEDDNVHVRRLVSEGCRPYLPWGIRLQVFANDPHLILPLLNKLKDDKSEYVRRSVANNLNDIAKLHPDVVVQILSQWWKSDSISRVKLITHACRTMLKNGHSGALALLGFLPPQALTVNLRLASSTLNLDGEQEVTLTVSNNALHSQKLMIDYAVHHQKANGELRPKVFKWRSLTLNPKSSITLLKRHSFRPVTTRKYYAGDHKIGILINGEMFCEQPFTLAKCD